MTLASSLPLEAITATLQQANELIYEWDMLSDQLKWSDNAAEALGVEEADITTGSAFSNLVKADSPNTRYDAIFGSCVKDNGLGVRYIAEYRMGKHAAKEVWAHDTGIWYSNEQGTPIKARGIMRLFPVDSKDFEGGQLSPFDPLTGQLTSIRLFDRLENAILGAHNKGNSAGFVLASINKLSKINEAYGFAAADLVISEVGKRIAGNVRGRDTVGRYSGNKFGIVLPGCDDLELKIAAERVIQAIEKEPIVLCHGSIKINVSMGGVILPRYAQNAKQAILCAQEALHEGRDRKQGSYFGTYSKSTATASSRVDNQKMAANILTALNDHRVLIHYQPVVKSHSGEIAFHECLLKVRQDDGSLASAQTYVEEAEKLEMVHLLDCRVLELACGALFSEPQSRLSINISAKTANDPDWMMRLAALRRHYGSFNQRLIVEITETAALHDIDDTKTFIKVLKDMGCLVALDDFGAGYTSFHQLKELSPDIVKIDGNFVLNLADNPQNQVFCKALSDIAKAFNIEIVAEYVERQVDADILKKWDIEYLQGYLFGRAAEHICLTQDQLRKTA